MWMYIVSDNDDDEYYDVIFLFQLTLWDLSTGTTKSISPLH